MLALYSNNPLFATMCEKTAKGEYKLVSALIILETARDAIHKGWKLLNHPLYGNYRPYQQPFRTILLEGPRHTSADFQAPPVNLESLNFIEEALLVFNSTKGIHPKDAPKKLFEDCAELDFALMQLTLEYSGVEIVRGTSLPQQPLTTPQLGG